MPIFTVEVRRGVAVLDRFIAAPFHREGDELVNTKGYMFPSRPDIPGEVELLFFEPVTELYLGTCPVEIVYDDGRMGTEYIDISPGKIKISFTLGNPPE